MTEQEKQLRTGFLSESNDLIESLEKEILRLEKDFKDNELKKSILRNIHTLKGSAGMVDREIIPNFVHNFEATLKSYFEQQQIITNDIDFILTNLDYITFLIDAVIKKKQSIVREDYELKLQKLQQCENNITKSQNQAFGVFEQDQTAQTDLQTHEEFYRISFRLQEKRMEQTWYPESFIDDLSKLGKIYNIHGQTFREINWPEADFSQCHFEWTILLRSKYKIDKLQDVFIFFNLNNDIEIEQIPDDKATLLGEILISDRKISRDELQFALSSPLKLGEELVKEKKVFKKDITKALQKQANFRHDLEATEQLKIPAKKVNQLIDLIGELIINNSNLNQIIEESENIQYEQIQYNIDKVGRQMRDLILSLKMVPIGQLLTRYYRLVRDLSKEVNKEVELKIQGENTELDKTMFNILQEPFVHLIRNSLDHGLETTDERIKAGKNKKGTIVIRSYQDNGQIVIEIEDDGKGLDRDKIYEKGLAKGLLEKNKTYRDQEIYDLIFSSGFSTKDKTSLISGRGVGMDAVLASVKQVSGSLTTKSVKGKGTIFCIRIPLTLAIIEGFLVHIGINSFIIPLNFIAECFEVSLSELAENDMVCNLRGEYLPVVQLDDFFPNICYEKEMEKKKAVVVIEFDNNRIGLLVDRISGNNQTVIKPLIKIVNKSGLLAGSSIIGNGDVALIIDVGSLFRLCLQK